MSVPRFGDDGPDPAASQARAPVVECPPGVSANSSRRTQVLRRAVPDGWCDERRNARPGGTGPASPFARAGPDSRTIGNIPEGQRALKKRSRSRAGLLSFSSPAGRKPLASCPAGASKPLEFDPSATWRRRRRDAIRVLSAMERRYLLDLVAHIEASGGSIGDEVFVSARRVVSTGTPRTARSLSLLVGRGVLALSTRDGRLRSVITEAGRQLLRRWFATKPPDFTKRFPRLYQEFRSRKDDFDGSCDEATRFV